MSPSYPHLSERCARVFAMASIALREMQNGPRERILSERYRKAADYLWSRIGR